MGTVAPRTESELRRHGRELLQSIRTVLDSHGWSDVRTVLGHGVSEQATSEGPEVRVELIGLSPAPAAREIRETPAQFRARYSIRVRSADTGQTQDVLNALIFEAFSTQEWEANPASSAASALPEVAFIVTAIVRRVPTTVAPPRVLHPIGARPPGSAPMMRSALPLVGRLLGPGQRPIAGALVRVPQLGATATSDGSGYFRIGAAPVDGALLVEISAKGNTWTLQLERAAGSDPENAIECFCDFKE